jgi:hypothetical protein
MVNLYWGDGELESEMIFLYELPRKGDELQIEVRNVADDPGRWRVQNKTIHAVVVRVKHCISIDYGNEVGPDFFQSVDVFAVAKPED